MKKNILRILTITLILSFVNIFASEDSQTWNSIALSGNITKNLKLKIGEEYRHGDNMTTLYYQHTDFGFSYKVLPWLSTGVNYRNIYEVKHNWMHEKRPQFNLAFTYKIANVKLKDRSRLEYRIRSKKDSVFRYRNAFTISYKIKFTAFSLSPYLADEIFYDIDENELNRNRIYAGFSISLYKHFSIRLSYVRQADKKNNIWYNKNAMALNLGYKF